MKQYHYKYGHGQMEFSLDPALVKAELAIKDYPVLPDPVAAVEAAIREPIGAAPLWEIVSPGQTVAFIVNDPTRVANTHVFLPVLIDEIHAVGVPYDDMCIVFALGSHRLMSEAEMIEEVGADVAAKVKMYNSDCKDPAQFQYFGETSRGTPVYFHKKVAEADHIILTGSVVHHFFAGFGGGRKALFPGVAAYETIRKNHSMMFDPNAVIGKLDGNPIYHDQIEGAEMCRPSFLLNVVLNEEKQFLKVFAGHYINAHREACTFVDEVYGAPIRQETDLVIASCGGYPKDINLYQGSKTIDNAFMAVKPGGVIICFLECRDITEPPEFSGWFKHKDIHEFELALRERFTIPGYVAFKLANIAKQVSLIIVTHPNNVDFMNNAGGIIPATSAAEAMAIAKEKIGRDDFTVTVMDHGAN